MHLLIVLYSFLYRFIMKRKPRNCAIKKILRAVGFTMTAMTTRIMTIFFVEMK